VEPGTVGILNVGAGDTRLSFDPKDPAECIRAARIVRDMLRRGYALLIEVERKGVKKFERALDFDDKTSSYIIADLDPVAAEKADKEEREHGPAEETKARQDSKRGAKVDRARGKGNGRRAIKASGTRAVAVARSAGG